MTFKSVEQVANGSHTMRDKNNLKRNDSSGRERR